MRIDGPIMENEIEDGIRWGLGVRGFRGLGGLGFIGFRIVGCWDLGFPKLEVELVPGSPKPSVDF